MTELPSVRPSGNDAIASRAVADLAYVALREVGRCHQAAQEPGLPAHVHAVARAAAATDPDALAREILMLRERGLEDPAILDHVIPGAAAILGEAWERDTATFMTVTVAASRLQLLARAVAARIDTAPPAPCDTAVLLVVPESEDHTLGAIIAASQYQRRGCDAALMMKAPAAAVADAAGRRHWDVAVIAAAHEGNLTQVARLVGILRRALPETAPVLVAGPLAARRDGLAGEVGADQAVCCIGDTLDIVDRCRNLPLARAVGQV
ncbi:MAG: hypothetical protein N2422_09765 [Rhodobacteraceae bacterium]|nr:hypothetical protein [Paracoccaceae bacterium]